ncbi:IS701 family transposase [Mesorhizobium sp.]|uniref:IS701 family transposase n=1 Tax=Mesorhizobium sp. TaxID=1871066 RepID=UPI000FE49874|nr:IS701 family transposase [Mesorhizobium sp.]RWK27611.1 MAG: IS701 family transposase [Mesorhizobium sp.]RWK59670.1 MAG: IS701 family transposase [Mesorhizobium sp.]RWK68358.1 MAG: IS701 family transposase [Mesorhizobium sp.]RWK73276.1 MAG: IS701 family transposase [Mesorhizobium sp.]RWK96624.1 MAG: IS701 family transposase [Mesorhizobium sp.]
MSAGTEARFEAYVAGLSSVLGHADRIAGLKDYCTGLMLPLERKSVEPLAAATAPDRVSAQHQSLMHFVSQSAWSDDKVLAKVRELVWPSIEAHGPIEAWIIDDTSFRKQGRHSVGVARQYCGEIGKQDNCQVAVSLSLANAFASLPVAFRLYLPKEWAEDPGRRKKAGVPEQIGFSTKPQMALEQIRWACEAGLPRGVVLMDPGYGHDGRLRTGVSALGLSYVAGVQANAAIFGPNARSEPDATLAKDIALSLPAMAWRQVEWREGTNETLASRFARVRAHSAHRRPKGEALQEEWLLIEWPQGQDAPTKYWLSTLPEHIAFERLVELAKLRWRIERDYQDLKQELGLDHFEGRSWRGLHHHATLTIAAYGFLICERETIPPSGPSPSRHGAQTGIPAGYRPRGAPDPARAAHPQLDRHAAQASYRGSRRPPATMSLLRQPEPGKHAFQTFMTQ